MTEENPYEKLEKSNGDYHEAVDGVLMDENVEVEMKAQFANICNDIFSLFKRAQEIIKAHYEPEGE